MQSTSSSQNWQSDSTEPDIPDNQPSPQPPPVEKSSAAPAVSRGWWSRQSVRAKLRVLLLGTAALPAVLLTIGAIAGAGNLNQTRLELEGELPADLDLLETELNATRNRLIWGGVGLGIVSVGVAAVVAERSARGLADPLQQLAGFAKQLGSGGESGSVASLPESDRADEIGVLTREMNQMAASLEMKEGQLRRAAKRANFLAGLAGNASAIARSGELNKFFRDVLQGTRVNLDADRAVIYRLNEDGIATIVQEVVVPPWPAAAQEGRRELPLGETSRQGYLARRSLAIDNVSSADLANERLTHLDRLQVKAELSAAIVVEGQLYGIAAVHQCASTRNWSQEELDFLGQVASTVGNAVDRASNLEQLYASAEDARKARAALQARAKDLLVEVEPITKGDLTIRARVTNDEVGTIADSYNSAIESLGAIVARVKRAAQQVAATTTANESEVRELAAEAERQARDIGTALARIQAMTESSTTVAESAENAESALSVVNRTLDEGEMAMNRTVESIVAIRQAFGDIDEKVKVLNDTSQKISQAVNSIGRFAAQTNLLALKTSIEAARAGEEGKGFTVIAAEVRSLAQQSAEATSEIEALVSAIQSETKEALSAMTAGNQQVESGTQLVETVRANMARIAEASQTANQLVSAIALAATEQSKSSQQVSTTIAEVATVADRTSSTSVQVSGAFEELLAVARELEATVGQFKVNL